MKKIVAIVLVSALLITLAGCTSDGDPLVTTTAATTTTTAVATTTTLSSVVSTTISTTTVAEQEYTGGDDFDYITRYVLDFSLESALIALVDEEDYRQWRDTFEGTESGGTRSKYELNVYELIVQFNITRAQVEEICREHKEQFPDDEYFTDEEVNILFTGTRDEVYRYFANPHAIYMGPGANVYPPKWLAEHTAEEYLAVGITYDILNAKLDDVLYDHLPDTPRQHILAQLEALKNME